MSAIIIPFPPCCRADLVLQEASVVARMSRKEGEQRLISVALQLWDQMEACGIAADAIEPELECFAKAVWNVVLAAEGLA